MRFRFGRWFVNVFARTITHRLDPYLVHRQIPELSKMVSVAIHLSARSGDNHRKYRPGAEAEQGRG